MQSKEPSTTSANCKATTIYNNAKLIFHAIGSKFRSVQLEGIDPSQSLKTIDLTLEQFMEEKPNLSQKMQDCISKMRKSISSAKSNYLSCIGLVNLTDEPSIVKEMALKLSQDVKSLADTQPHPSILFIGGHYLHPKGGSLGGHTASYEVTRQDNGKLSFLINNTVKIEKYHKINGNRIHQLVYTDLEATDLDVDFWVNVIRTNYMNPVRGSILMDSFYDYVNLKLLKASDNKTTGRSFKSQEVGVCAWKSISVWLHGKISPDNENRDSSNELIYLQLKTFMFKKMLVHYTLNESFNTTITIRKDNNGDILNETAAIFLITELERKIKKYDIASLFK